MVALSVSISASTSPFFTVSPTCLCQPAITPTSMVSLRRGISTTSSILDKSKVVVEAVETIVSVAGELDGVEDGEGVTGVAAAAGLLSKDEISSPSLPIMANRSFTWIFDPFSPPKCKSTPSL